MNSQTTRLIRLKKDQADINILLPEDFHNTCNIYTKILSTNLNYDTIFTLKPKNALFKRQNSRSILHILTYLQSKRENGCRTRVNGYQFTVRRFL